MEWEREGKRSSWESCMKEFILYVSPNWSPWQFPVSFIHTWQQINLSTLFRRSLSWNLWLWVFLFACVTGHGCTYVSSLEREGKERKKKLEHGEAKCTEELLYVFPNWNTWFQIVGLFFMPPGCQVRLFSNCTWKVSTFGFPLPVCFYWDMTERFRMHAAGDWRTHCLGLIVLPLSNQEVPMWGDGIFPDPIINNWTHFHDLLYYFGFKECMCPLLLELNGCSFWLSIPVCPVCPLICACAH